MKCIVATLMFLGAVAACSQTVTPAHSQEYNGEFANARRTVQATDRFIVKWRGADNSSARIQKAATASGLRLQHKQSMSDGAEVLQSDRPLAGAELDAAIERLQADPNVVYAAPDLRRHIHALTSDPLLTEQWYLLSAQPAATRTEQAWDITMGSASTIVAVLDTGVRFEHPDLGRLDQGGKLLAGYDFVSNPAIANDGSARDADPSDPGDWVTAADAQQPPFNSDCIPDGRDHVDSSWHGTRVAGLIGALTNNAAGVAGAAWNTVVLPVRVLGKCGGFDSDIIDAARWAAGIAVAGIPANPNPAKIINLSLGGDGLCTAAYQAVVNEITARGVLIVASAGNDGGPVSAPANCPGVLGVAGLRHIGTKVGFSNLGPELSIGAPGGNCINTGQGQPCLFSIIVATNTGTTTPVASAYTNQINFNVGTSFSAPQTAAAAALMRNLNTRLVPSQVITLLKQTAVAFPVNGSAAIPNCHVPTSATDLQAAECNCTTQTCGAGMLNTAAAVDAALRPFAILQTTGTVVNGATISLDASASFASNGRSLTSFQWSVQNLTGSAPVVMAPTQATTTLQITGASQFTLRLTVTDDQGGQDVEEVALATPAAEPPPVTPSRAGGGGGQLGWEVLGLALLSAALRRSRRETSDASVPPQASAFFVTGRTGGGAWRTTLVLARRPSSRHFFASNGERRRGMRSETARPSAAEPILRRPFSKLR